MTPPRGRPLRSRLGTLRFRVSAISGLAVILVLGVASVWLVVAQRSALLHDLDENLEQQADALFARMAAGEAIDRGDLFSDDIAVLATRPAGEIVVGAPGVIDEVFRYGPAPAAVPVRTLDVPGPEGAVRILFRERDGSRLWAAAPLDDVRDSVTALVRSLFVAVPVSVAVLVALVWWAVGRTLRPVEAIRAQVEGISATKLERRVPEPRGSEEIARLARTMNAMLERLHAAAQRQRRFVADASHELRGPLTRMRAELEVDRAHPDSADPAATAASVLEETVALQRLVDDLLLLARGDAGPSPIAQPGPVDLDDLVGRLVAGRRRGAAVRIETPQVAPVQVLGDVEQLRRAASNLLDNAVRHASQRVTVTVTEKDGVAALTVSDDGPGIPEHARELVFQRFTRLDDARSADSGGAGLGLPIARDIAERHGGRLVLTGDACFVLTFPLHTGAPAG